MLRVGLIGSFLILLLGGCSVIGGTRADAGTVGLLVSALLLGIRHGIDWDHIAAIVDITSTTATADAGEAGHLDHHRRQRAHTHGHGGSDELSAHAADADPMDTPHVHRLALTRWLLIREQRRAILLGTLYALGHALVVALLGLAALLFGALLPDWIDPIMGRVVGITLIVLGIWVFYSIYQYARHGHEFRLRSRWMLVFDGVRYTWRRLMARLHGHEHADPIEMSAYGTRTALGVGMIHGIGAETGTQVLIIAAVGGAAGIGLGVPMMLAFIIGLLISNTAIILLSATGFVASQLRQRIYVAVGLVAGVFSLAIGLFFVVGAEGALPDLAEFFRFIGG